LGYGTPLIAATQTEMLGGTTGTTVTSGAGAYGSLATIGTTTFGYDGFMLNVGGATADAHRLTITSNVAGVDNEIVTDLLVMPIAASVMGQIYIPVHVPSGSTIKCKTRARSGSANTLTIGIMGLRGDANLLKGFGRVVSATDFGAGWDASNLLTLNGVTLTAWVQLRATTPKRFAGLYVAQACSTAGTGRPGMLEIGTGASGSEISRFKILIQGSGTLNTGSPNVPAFVPCQIPSGVRLAARAQMAGTTVGVISINAAGIEA
jgi:hypothetical protein